MMEEGQTCECSVIHSRASHDEKSKFLRLVVLCHKVHFQLVHVRVLDNSHEVVVAVRIDMFINVKVFHYQHGEFK